MKSINIVDPCELDKIVDIIHDYHFDIDAIENDNDTFKIKIAVDSVPTIVRKKFFVLKQFETKVRECVLCIYGVKSYDIEDTEKIGMYPFNEINFNSDDCTVSILCSIPIKITINVAYFKMSLDITDKIIQTKKNWGIFKSLWHDYV